MGKMLILKPVSLGHLIGVHRNFKKITQPPTLKELQEIVEGYIEIVDILYKDKPCQMIVNEDGKLKDLPINSKATEIYVKSARLSGHTPDVIFGNVVVLEDIRVE